MAGLDFTFYFNERDYCKLCDTPELSWFNYDL